MKKNLLIFLLFPMLLFSQQKQPKIGLVLSGGGAKGLAHIGVLKEIDKAGLQIDYIGGTSMGAIIGGLYASGYSGIQIEKIADSLNLVNLLQDVLPRSSKPFFEKEFGEKHAIVLPINKRGIALPRAVSKGQKIVDLFSNLFSHLDTISDFKKLPIPFYCIATDAESGKMVVLEEGSLPLALRASSSFPTLLNPVELNNHLLIDGGIANNFPSDIMNGKDIDIIIGVDVQSGLIKREKLNSVVSILNQIISYDIYEQSKKAVEDSDIYIKPDISAFRVIDYNKSKEIIKKGDEVAVKFKKTFDSISKLQYFKKEKPTVIFTDEEFVIEQINVIGAENYTPAFVRGKLNLRIGDQITRRELNTRINFLTSTNNYYQIYYKVNGNKVNLYLKEEPSNKSLRLGAHYDNLYQSGILANYVHKRLLIKNDELSFDLIVGDRLRYQLNYFVDNGFYTSYGFKSRYNHFNTNTLFTNVDNPDVNRIELNYSDFTNEAFVQTTFGRKFAIGLGLEFKKLLITTETITTSFNNRVTFDNSNYLNFLAYLKLDTYNDKSFPTKGFYADVGSKFYIWSSDYLTNFQPFPQISGRIGFASTFFESLTFQYTNDAGFTFENPTSQVFDFYIGGYNQNYINTFFPMYGYEFAQLSDKSFLRSEFLFRYKITKDNYATFIANYAKVDKNVFGDFGGVFKDILSGYAFGYSLDTILGPIEIKYSWSPDHNKKYWLFNLGFWF